jgi:CheY-like chemotaxis protein
MPGKKLKVLLVEDNKAHAELTRLGFKDCRCETEIHLVNDGEEAMDYLYKRGKYGDKNAVARPDIVLLDLRLPKIDGLEVLRMIKSDKDLEEIPVIVLSTSDSEKDISKAYEYHVNSYLVKPDDFETFSQMLQDTGEYWSEWNKNTY